MGNAALCAPSILSSGAIKILSSDGRLTVYTRTPLKAAEIMSENPGQFLCEPNDLKVGQRIAGMSGEEELERGQLYVLLPMEMLYSVLTTEEMNSLAHVTTKGWKHAAGTLSFSRIFPEFCLFPSVSEVRAVEGSAGRLEMNDRLMTRQRSWEPALETIVETPPHA
ncbi:uncharacterized protein LOC127263180 [Andrographis paniculata]|uniref:uncharacterized protein LOC127263180 n=1 Tax=Andrographis paniculata TaxID=175694 RepID=UPI0021E92022|nr:uncharacterized protein LOC127263180 [Andrographis paniculata]XP_051148152.1 uncharacterized protein LOC127263180 [Andrographis paniculata]